MKKPPQGTHRIFDPEKMNLYNWQAAELSDDTYLYVIFKHDCPDDPDFLALLEMKADGMLSDERVSPHLVSMYERYPRNIVGRIFRFIKFSPMDMIRSDWEALRPE